MSRASTKYIKDTLYYKEFLNWSQFNAQHSSFVYYYHLFCHVLFVFLFSILPILGFIVSIFLLLSTLPYIVYLLHIVCILMFVYCHLHQLNKKKNTLILYVTYINK